jgi:hypothetical protein
MNTPTNSESLPLTNYSALQKCAYRIAGHIEKPMDIYAIIQEINSDEYNAELMLQHLILWAAINENPTLRLDRLNDVVGNDTRLTSDHVLPINQCAD